MRRTRRSRDNSRDRNRRSMHAHSRAGTGTHCRAHMDSGANMDTFARAELDPRRSSPRRYGRSSTHEHAYRNTYLFAYGNHGFNEYRNPVANDGTCRHIDEHQYPDCEPYAIAYNYCDSYDFPDGNHNTDCFSHGHPYTYSNYRPHADRYSDYHTASGRCA